MFNIFGPHDLVVSVIKLAWSYTSRYNYPKVLIKTNRTFVNRSIERIKTFINTTTSPLTQRTEFKLRRCNKKNSLIYLLQGILKEIVQNSLKYLISKWLSNTSQNVKAWNPNTKLLYMVPLFTRFLVLKTKKKCSWKLGQNAINFDYPKLEPNSITILTVPYFHLGGNYSYPIFNLLQVEFEDTNWKENFNRFFH